MTKPALLLTSIVLIALAYMVVSFPKPNTQHERPTLSFYHWANTYKADRALEARLSPKHLYIKLLDIAYRQQRLVVHSTRMESPLPEYARPVIYIDNGAMKQAALSDLFTSIVNQVPPEQFSYLQLDCDWTPSTRERYFTLLSQLGEHYDTLTATIRLHQLKYFTKTGVPPVKKGILMYYNMSDVRDITINNYVLDDKIGVRYLGSASYPLPLDLALPLYQQTRLIRQNKLIRLLPGVDLVADKLKQTSPNQYEVVSPHYWQGEYLYKNDVLALDRVSESALLAAAETLRPHMRPDELIFYRLRDARRFPDATFDGLIDMFSE